MTNATHPTSSIFTVYSDAASVASSVGVASAPASVSAVPEASAAPEVLLATLLPLFGELPGVGVAEAVLHGCVVSKDCNSH